MYTTIEIHIEENIATIWLNRPQVCNAFNGIMVQELTLAFYEIEQNEKVKVLIIRGRGSLFCAGADLLWMKALGEASYEEDIAESRRMAQCFYNLSIMPKPVISVAHGSVMGGGIGLVAAADIAICPENTVFAFSEVKHGLVPAVISPYVIRRIGEAKAREFMLTGRKFSGIEALHLNLVNRVVDEDSLDQSLHDVISQLLANSPEAMCQTKTLITSLSSVPVGAEILDYTAETITRARKSADGKEGMLAFSEKRNPVWK
jgi:methylglutaconyl-CoA hydratase